ncbi:hypothetical protein WICPIJ_003958 [Wickerhamomyces pijperi]|uniref:Anaphase-promoting complex subunit 5 n=1 Tax=Wickerhamomyces pijperi TaxID=599730 RepID=A0A9P8TN90_WICPI|nr:hypothetical protein WICPIJ_003958 [Wickerhamomyces pijperi]
MTFENANVVLTPTLAPYKIALIALIAAYCSSIFPKKANRPILSVIVKYIEGPYSLDDTIPLNTVPTLLEILRNIKEVCIKADPEEGVKHANEIEIRALHALWSLKSLDSLYSFISKSKILLVKSYTDGKKLIEQRATPLSTNSASLLPKYLLTHNSFLGSFILSCVNSFETLEFDKIDLLWTGFVEFRSSSKGIYDSELRARGTLPVDMFGATSKDDDPSSLVDLSNRLSGLHLDAKKSTQLVSQEDLLKLLTHQVNVLETYGTSTTPELRSILARMPQSETGKLPTIHYIHYLECLKEADYEGAFNYLHRYFDYMMSKGRMVYYHYALLSLATLYAAFNCDGEAIRAIEESISVARENKDIECLNFLLTWLFNFLKDRPNLEHQFYGSTDQLLQFLKSRTTNDSFKSLDTTAYQCDAVQLMMEGGALSTIYESLTKSLYISVNCGSDSSSFSSHCSLASAFWNRAGNLDLSTVYNDIALSSTKSSTGKSIINARDAYTQFSIGNVENCFKILEDQEKVISRDMRIDKDFANHKLLLLVQQNIRTSNFHAAQSYLDKLNAQSFPNLDIQGQTNYLLAELHLKTGNVSKAHEIILNFLEKFAQRDTNRYWYIKFNILFCELLIQTDVPMRALSMTIQILNISMAGGYFTLSLECILRLTEVLIGTGSYEDARDVIMGYLPTFEYSDELFLKCQAYQLILVITMKIFEQSQETHDYDEKVKTVSNFINYNEVAIDGFKKFSAFREIKNCLESQLHFAELISHEELYQHAEKSLIEVEAQIELNETSLY